MRKKSSLSTSRLRLKQIDGKVRSEKSKNYVYVAERREPIYECFGIAYLSCSENLNSKISRLYYSVVVFGE